MFQATTGKVMARLEAEAANPRADVLISASWDRTGPGPARLAAAPRKPQRGPGAGALQAPSYVAQGISALGIVWNTKSGTPEPRDWADLTGPGFKQAVTMPDPALSGASLDLLLGLQNAQGEAAWKLFETLRDTA